MIASCPYLRGIIDVWEASKRCYSFFVDVALPPNVSSLQNIRFVYHALLVLAAHTKQCLLVSSVYWYTLL